MYDLDNLTPMMKQYMSIKNRYKDCLLFFRLGDFYEMFFNDAVVASRELEITLTQRGGGMEDKIPMCGVPHHVADVYVSRLVAKGYKVAICEQMEDPALAKGIVKRDVIRVVTPGTITDSNVLEEKETTTLYLYIWMTLVLVYLMLITLLGRCILLNTPVVVKTIIDL